MATPFARIAVVGTGLIGGSFAMAARALPGVYITGWDKPEILERAQASGVIDEGHSELGKAIAGADLIYLALPVGLTLERIPEIAHMAAPGALVTDAASTKRAVCAAAETHVSKGALFLGGHPMAGSEGSGLAAADAGLFRGAKYALIGKGAGGVSRGARVGSFVGLIEAMGGTPIWMDAATHDRAAAVVSHLPQLLAVAL